MNRILPSTPEQTQRIYEAISNCVRGSAQQREKFLASQIVSRRYEGYCLKDLPGYVGGILIDSMVADAGAELLGQRPVDVVVRRHPLDGRTLPLVWPREILTLAELDFSTPPSEAPGITSHVVCAVAQGDNGRHLISYPYEKGGRNRQDEENKIVRDVRSPGLAVHEARPVDEMTALDLLGWCQRLPGSQGLKAVRPQH